MRSRCAFPTKCIDNIVPTPALRLIWRKLQLQLFIKFYSYSNFSLTHQKRLIVCIVTYEYIILTETHQMFNELNFWPLQLMKTFLNTRNLFPLNNNVPDHIASKLSIIILA